MKEEQQKEVGANFRDMLDLQMTGGKRASGLLQRLIGTNQANMSLEELDIPEEELELRRRAKELGLHVDELSLILEAYVDVDTDGSGQIEKDEFEALLSTFCPDGIKPKRFQLDEWWNQVDTDRNGLIDFDEFIAWYLKAFRAA